MNVKQMRQLVLGPSVEAVEALVVEGERDGAVLMAAWIKSINENPSRVRECVRQVGEHVVADRVTAHDKPTTKKAPRVPAKLARMGIANLADAPARLGYDLMVARIAAVDGMVENTDAYRAIVKTINDSHVDWAAYQDRLLRELCADLHVPEQLVLALQHVEAPTGTDG